MMVTKGYWYVWWCLTSGIVDASAVLGLCLSCCGEGVGRVGWRSHALRGWGWGQARCWVLKNQPCGLPPMKGVVVWLGLLVLLRPAFRRVRGVWGLVGLLFEICIVD